MGGSGGSYSGGGYTGGGAQPKTGGGGGGGGGANPCQISIDVTLASPNPAVVSTLSTGDILVVALNASGGTPIVEVRAPAGVAGTLAGMPNLRTLIDCLQNDVDYEFEVTAIAGGRVDGRLRNA